MDLITLTKLNLREQVETNLEDAIYDMFSDKKPIKDKDVHTFAASMGLDPSIVETAIYKLLQDFLAHGKWNESGNPDVDETELNMGIKVEMEHTINAEHIARRIALDHLSECRDYYTRLAKMEAECGSE